MTSLLFYIRFVSGVPTAMHLMRVFHYYVSLGGLAVRADEIKAAPNPHARL
jgi:hypothetical protein